jgi:Tfp pilus assembly protein PilX
VDALLIVVIVLAVLMGLIGLGVVAGSGRARRMEENRIHADELRRESEFHDARAEQARAEAEERVARARREEAAARRREEEAAQLDPDAEAPPRRRRFQRDRDAGPTAEEPAAEDQAPDSPEQLPGPRDER